MRLAAIARDHPDLIEPLQALLAETGAAGPLDRTCGDLVAALFTSADADVSRAGERVGSFRLLHEIGRGGMGAVYAAERVDGGFAQDVAIKILRPGLDSEHVLRRFLAERRILARLEHPHIARLIDGGLTEDGLPWFALERVDGQPITVEAERRHLDVAARLAWFLEVCDAVQFAHERRVVHRDIKPSNVLVDGEGRVKLLDFGIAKLLDAPAENLTRTAMQVFTPHYAAPEQVSGGEISAATDVWQLGRLLHELVPPPRGRDLDTIVARATHDDSRRRYDSAASLADDVRRYLDGRPIVARADSIVYRMTRFVRRHRAAAMFAIAGAALALGWLATVLRRADAGQPLPSLQFERVSTFPGSHSQASFSPDGRSIAFLMEDATGTPQVWTKVLASGDPVQITSDSRGAHRPRWSPRGDVIFFDVPATGIWTIPAGGGTPRQLVPEGYNVDVSADGERIVYEIEANLWMARADGSLARRLGAWSDRGLEKEYAFVESTPAFSPDGREVVYFQDHDGPLTGDIWTIAVDGGERRRLTSDQVRVSHPTWLPDGSGIVYSSDRRGGLTLWYTPAAGGSPIPLTTGTGEDTEPTISRDGRRLIYTNARNLLRLMWLNPVTGERRQLRENRSVLTHPSFSPDGHTIAVFEGDAGHVQLVTLRADGTGPRQLTRPPQNYILPEWSSDGRFLYYYAFPNPSFFGRMRPDGTSPEVVVPGWRFATEHGVQVSPDGRRVVYTQLAGGVPLATRVRDLQSGREFALQQPILWPRWSPDGSRLAGRARSRELTLCPASSDPCRGLGVDGTEARWSHDGSEIYFVKYAGYQGSREMRTTPLWKVRADGSSPVHVADLEGPSPVHFFYDISPTGEVAWASFVAGRQELWMAELPAGFGRR